jgi:hypothetical protein
MKKILGWLAGILGAVIAGYIVFCLQSGCQIIDFICGKCEEKVIYRKEATYLSEIKEDKSNNIYEGLKKNGDYTGLKEGFLINDKYCFLRGLGMHAPKHGIGSVEYTVPDGYSRFISKIGLAVDPRIEFGDKDKPKIQECRIRKLGSVRFRVLVNNIQQKEEVRIFGNDPFEVNVAVKGGDTLRLEVENDDGNHICDHSVWAEARFER